MNSIANSSKLRLIKDYKKIENGEIDGINACPEENNIYKWDGYIMGPDGTVWENGAFKIKMEFPIEYPSKPPNIKFISKIFHPNVYNDGRICLDILDKNWSPVYDVCSILISLRSLLTDPNENSPANVEAAQLYKQNIQEYYSRVKKCVEMSQIDDENEDVINSQTCQDENNIHDYDNIENLESLNQIHNTNNVNVNVNLNDNNDNYSISNNNLNIENSQDEDDSEVHSIENVLGTISSHSMTFSNNNQNNNDNNSIISNTYSNSNSNISSINNHTNNNSPNVNINNNNDFSSPTQNNSYQNNDNI